MKDKAIKSKINIAKINSNAFILLLISAPLSMVAGVLFPTAGLVFEPYLLIWLGLLLFVNLIRLNPKDLLDSFAKPTNLVIMSFFNLLILPLGVYAITYFIYPKLALSATYYPESRRHLVLHLLLIYRKGKIINNGRCNSS